MSVFTPVPESVLADWLKDYAIGRLVELEGISAGVQTATFSSPPRSGATC